MYGKNLHLNSVRQHHQSLHAPLLASRQRFPPFHGGIIHALGLTDRNTTQNRVANRHSTHGESQIQIPLFNNKRIPAFLPQNLCLIHPITPGAVKIHLIQNHQIEILPSNQIGNFTQPFLPFALGAPLPVRSPGIAPPPMGNVVTPNSQGPIPLS